MSTGKLPMKYIHMAIMFIITFGVGYLPPFGSVTEFGMKIFGVFLGLMYAWIFLELYWSSLFGFVAMVAVGYSDIMSVFLTGMGSYMVMLMLLGAVLAGVIQQTGLSDSIIATLAKNERFNNSPWSLILSFLVVAAVLGMLGATYVGLFVLWGLASSICDANGEAKYSPLRSMMVALILFTIIGSGSIMPFSGGVVMVGAYMTQATGVAVQYVPYTINYLVWFILWITGMILSCKFILKVDVSGFKMTEEIKERFKDANWTFKQKFALAVMVIYSVLLFGSQLSSFFIFKFAAKMSVIGMTIIAIVLIAIVPDKATNKEIDFAVAFQGIPWASLLLVAVTIPLAAAMQSADAGIMTTVTELIMPLFTKLGLVGMLIVATVVLTIVSQVFHNMVLNILFIPFLAGITIEMGGSAELLFVLLYIGLNCATFATPAASAQAGLLFSNNEIKRSDAYKLGMICALLCIIILVCVNLPLGLLLY